MRNTLFSVFNEEHDGAVAFEYIIILVIMAVTIFIAWNLLSDAVEDKAREISEFIRNNGRGGLTGDQNNPNNGI